MQNTKNDAAYLIKFLVRILGARTPPPRMEEPVMKIPLRSGSQQDGKLSEAMHVPSGTQNAETYTETDPSRRPRIRACLLQEATDVERLTGT